ncbi:hypothetical protein [Vibrio mediterranei]|uniref:hypothetical protein n=1 Tax=Vibrio mediterranei TaxID=689 RepID=UPI0040676A5F
MKSYLIAVAALSLSVGATASVELEQRLSGYTKILVDTNFEQKDPLSKVVSISFPAGITNVGQGLNFTLETTGYKLEDLDESPVDVLRLYTMEIPRVNLSFERTTVRQVVDVLVGAGYIVSIDERLRKVKVRGKDNV